LSNGLTLIVQEDHVTDLVGVDVWVKTGSGNESKKNNGVSHFIEHLLFGATAKRQPGDMDREMESVGATLDAHTGKDYTHFSTTVSSRYLVKALDIFADAVGSSQFRNEDIERERPIILDEIAKKLNDPALVCRDLLSKELYGDHSYSLPIEGTPDTVKNISRRDILDYYHRYYVPGNIAVVLVGDIDKQTVTSEVERAFSSLSGALPQKQNSTDIKPLTSRLEKSVKASFQSTYLAIGFLGPSAANLEDVCATDVLITYLGLGYHSWMADKLKGEQKLAQDVSADFLTQREPGLISLIASTTDAARAKEAILAKLTDLRSHNISPGDLEVAKRSLLGQYAFQCETFGGRANSYGFYYAESDPAFASKYVDCVQSVTEDAVLKAAQKYLNPDSAMILIVGPDQGGEK